MSPPVGVQVRHPSCLAAALQHELQAVGGQGFRPAGGEPQLGPARSTVACPGPKIADGARRAWADTDLAVLGTLTVERHDVPVEVNVATARPATSDRRPPVLASMRMIA